MSEVANEDMAKSQPTDPSKAYDSKHGSYKPDVYPVDNTAANASPLPEKKDPWKGMEKK